VTWSIVARDPASGALGVAVTTKFFAVGALCPWVRAGVGALSTQALVNPTYGPRGIDLLTAGATAEDTARVLLASDAGRATRQLHIVDAKGTVAAHTGDDCIGWRGHRVGEGFSVAGNMLAGQAVVDATFESFRRSAGRSLAERFLDALDAGQAEGGDMRGKQSAAILIHDSEDYPALSLRVDDHAEPLAEMRRLHRLSQAGYGAYRRFIATKQDPVGVFDRSVIRPAVEAAEAAAKGT